MTDPRAVLAPAWYMTSVWDPARVVRASRTRATRAMFVCRVLPRSPLTHTFRRPVTHACPFRVPRPVGP
eukprot:4890232-Prymnesium_polylepis.1